MTYELVAWIADHADPIFAIAMDPSDLRYALALEPDAPCLTN